MKKMRLLVWLSSLFLLPFSLQDGGACGAKAHHAPAANSTTLELKVGLHFSVADSYGADGTPIPHATMFTAAIRAFDHSWFLPILSSPSFTSSNSSQMRGFSFGFFFNHTDSRENTQKIYLAVCGGISGNFQNLSESNSENIYLAILGGIEDSTVYVASVLDGGYAVPVWIANPNAFLRSSNASLVVDGKKQLKLMDYDGKVVWNLSNVGMMEMHDTGILVIYDTINKTNIVWRSSRDTLFQLDDILTVGNELTSIDSAYSARVEKGGLVLYVNTVEFMNERRIPYLTFPIFLDNPLNVSKQVILSSPCNGTTAGAEATFTNALNFHIQSSGPHDCDRSYFAMTSPREATQHVPAGPLSFVKLDNDGWLHNYAVPSNLAAIQQLGTTQNPVWERFDHFDYQSGNSGTRNILQMYLWGKCVVPNVCGAYGVCSAGLLSPCTCPPSSTFNAIDINGSYKGCTRVTPLPNCTKFEHINTTEFLQLNHTTSIFLFNEWAFNPFFGKIEECKISCLSNCTCNGFFHQVNNSACFFITDDRMSLLNLTDKAWSGAGWPVTFQASDYVTYLKKVKPSILSSPTSVVMSPPVSPSPGLVRSRMIAIVVASSFAAILGLGVAGCLFSRVASKSRLLREHAREAAAQEEELRDVLPLLPTRFSYADLREATDGFSNLLGSGGGGSVYAGTLPDGRKVAVKTLWEFTMKGESKQFLAELATIGQTRHHNIVHLVGFCWEVSSQLLVYEYMERGSLDQWLFVRGGIGTPQYDEGAHLLDWQTRYNVVLGVVRGLGYLHEDCSQPILHFDIKPQNILLDCAFVPKLGDFGMSRKMQRDMSEVVTRGLRGTPGYIAPEWPKHGVVSKKSDVYSMGMVMLEIVRGRKNGDPEGCMDDAMDVDVNGTSADCDSFEGFFFPSWAARRCEQGSFEGFFFPSWAARRCEQGLEMELVDKRLREEFNEEQAQRLIYTAFWCIQEDPKVRPNVPTVLQWLEGSSALQKPPFGNATRPSSQRFMPSFSFTTSISNPR